MANPFEVLGVSASATDSEKTVTSPSSLVLAAPDVRAFFKIIQQKLEKIARDMASPEQSITIQGALGEIFLEDKYSTAAIYVLTRETNELEKASGYALEIFTKMLQLDEQAAKMFG